TDKYNIHPYASNNLINKVAKQKRDSELSMKNMPAGNTGRSIWDVRKTELSFFYELYIELCALQEIAKEKDMTWMFITLTCPPSYHPNPELGRKSWDGKSIDDGKRYFQNRWDNIKKRFNKGRKRVSKWGHLKWGLDSGYGKRVREANKDGCIHEHVLLFCKYEYVDEYKKIFTSVFNEGNVDIRERGIGKNGEILEKEQSAASYAIKYITKQFGLDFKDFEDGKSEIIESSNAGMQAWKVATSIRTSSSFGYKSVITKYRESRKAINKNNNVKKDINSLLKSSYGNLTDLERASLESGGELSKSVLSLLVSDILFSVLPYDESFWVTNAKTTTDNEFYQLR
ncbi:hypothetical protein CGH50_24095, partial [Vibrio parahaemolyticus]